VAVEAQSALHRLADGGLVVYHEDAHVRTSVRREPKRKLKRLSHG
jgi:hypothetical protein